MTGTKLTEAQVVQLLRSGESCPPVPVAAAPVGTITTWEAG